MSVCLLSSSVSFSLFYVKSVHFFVSGMVRIGFRDVQKCAGRLGGASEHAAIWCENRQARRWKGRRLNPRPRRGWKTQRGRTLPDDGEPVSDIKGKSTRWHYLCILENHKRVQVLFALIIITDKLWTYKLVSIGSKLVERLCIYVDTPTAHLKNASTQKGSKYYSKY